MDQERAKVRVATLGNRPEKLDAITARVLSRDEPQPGRGLSPVVERSSITDLGSKGGGDHCTDASSAHQALTSLAWTNSSELSSNALHAFVELAQVLELIAQGDLENFWNTLSIEHAHELPR